MTVRHFPWGGYEIVVTSHSRTEVVVRFLSKTQEIVGSAIHGVKGFEVPLTGPMKPSIDTLLTHALLCSGAEYGPRVGRVAASPHHPRVMAALRRYVRMADHSLAGIEVWQRQMNRLHDRTLGLRSLHRSLAGALRRQEGAWMSEIIRTNLADVALQLTKSPVPTLNVYLGNPTAEPLDVFGPYLCCIPMTLAGTSYDETSRQQMVLEEIGVDMGWYASELKTISRLLEL